MGKVDTIIGREDINAKRSSSLVNYKLPKRIESQPTFLVTLNKIKKSIAN